MPRVALSHLAAGLLALALVTAGPAQEAPTRTTDRASTDTRTQPATPADASSEQPSGAAVTSGGVESESRRGAFLRASSLIGLPVQGLGETRLGTVGDILIDPRTYEMRYVLIDTGPGVGTTGLPIIPWALFQRTAAGPVQQGVLVVPLSTDRLAQAPATTLGSNDLAGNSPWIRDVDHFYALDLSVRRVSRPELDVDAEERSPGTRGAETTPIENPKSKIENPKTPGRPARRPGPSGSGTPRH